MSYIFYPVRLFSCDVDIQLSRQCFGGRPGGLGVFGFPFLRFLQADYFSILFRSLRARLLIPAHLIHQCASIFRVSRQFRDDIRWSLLRKSRTFRKFAVQGRSSKRAQFGTSLPLMRLQTKKFPDCVLIGMNLPFVRDIVYHSPLIMKHPLDASSSRLENAEQPCNGVSRQRDGGRDRGRESERILLLIWEV